MEWNAQGRSSRALLCLPGPQDQFKSRAGPGRDLRAGVKTLGRSPARLIFNFWMQYYLHNGLSVPHSSFIEKNQYFTEKTMLHTTIMPKKEKGGKMQGYSLPKEKNAKVVVVVREGVEQQGS
jgi:hypothetical protein